MDFDGWGCGEWRVQSGEFRVERILASAMN
jgi:hypothetical protein